jgi:hypothetical protein
MAPERSSQIIDFSARYNTYLCIAHCTSFSGHTWDASSFDLGIEDNDFPLEDAKTTNQPHPNASSNSQMLVGPLHNNSKETLPISRCQTPMLMAPQLSTAINQVPNTPVMSIAPFVATPMTVEMAKHYTAHQTPEQFIKNTCATPNEFVEDMSFGAVFTRILESESPSNKNPCAWDEEFSDVPPVKHTLVEGKFVKSHWFLGYEHPRRENDVLLPLCNSLCTSHQQELDRYAMFSSPDQAIDSNNETVQNNSCKSIEVCS